MPDQTLNINVVTKADTSGLDEVKTKLDGVSASVAEQLAAAGATFDPVTKQFASAAKEAENIGFGATFAGAQINKAKGEAVVLARELATGSVNARTIGALLGALGTPMTIAAIAGIGLGRVIFDMVKSSAQLSEEIKKANDLLAEQELTWSRLASTAGDFKDQVQLAVSMIPELKKLADAAAKSLTAGISPDQGLSFNAPPASLVTDMDRFNKGLSDYVETQKASSEAAQEWARIQDGPVAAAISIVQAKIDGLKSKSQQLVGANQQQLMFGPVDPKATQQILDQLTSIQRQTEVWQGRLDTLNTKQERQNNLVKETGDQIRLNVATGNEELTIQERVTQAYDKKLKALKDAGVPEKEATDEAIKYAASVETALRAKTAEKTQHQDISAQLREEQTLIQGIRQQQQLIQGNAALGPDAKAAALLSTYKQEMAALGTEIKKLEADQKNTALDGPQLEQVNQKLQQARFEVKLLGQDISKLQGPLTTELQNWANSFGTTMHQVGDTIKGTVTAAFSELNNYIVTGTFNLQSFLQQIELLGLKLLEQLAIQEVISLIGGAASVAQAKVIGPQIAAAYAGAATAVSTASYGVAAGVGATSELAALATITGALTGSSGAKKGGYTGSGSPDEIAGPAHRGEFYFTAEQTARLGVPFLIALAAAAGGVARMHTGGPVYDFGDSGFGFPPATGPGSDPGYGYGDRPGGVNISDTSNIGGPTPFGWWGTTPGYGQPISGPTAFPTTWNYDPVSGDYIPSAISLGDPSSSGFSDLAGAGMGNPWEGGSLAGGMLHALGYHEQFHSGGLMPDEIPFIGQAGEFLHQRSAVEHYGIDFMHAINEMRIPSHHAGGAIGSLRGSGSAKGVGDVHVYPVMDPRAIIKHMTSRSGQKVIFDVIRGKRIDLGI